MLSDNFTVTMVMLRTLSVVLFIGFLAKGCHSQLNVCGVASLNTKIVGGQDAKPGSWPWQVSLQTNNFHFCGGSLINSGWVLTAAHCFPSVTSQVTVYLGEQSLGNPSSNVVSRKVSQIIKHPGYISTTNDNDIALLKLESTVTFTPYITPVCLAATGSTFFNGTLTWVTGWGDTAYGVSLPNPMTLQEVQVPVIGNRKCNCLYGVGRITNNMICAGLLAGGKDSCQGDSGGPLVSKQGGIWVQAGIVSFGEGCALPNFPGVYTRVSEYENWINQQITSNQPGFVTYSSSGTDGDLSVSCAGLPAVTTTTTTTTIPTTTAPPLVCGNAQLNTITGGGSLLASAGVWPWMVSLQRNGTHICGGTLIAQQYVLSSSLCFNSSSNASDWTVVLGLLNLNGSNPNQVSVNVTAISRSDNASNSIAVLQLSSQPKLSNYIQPICVDLGDNSFPIGLQCWATGWGSGGGVTQTLQQFNTTIVDCGNSSLSNNTICIQGIPLEQSEFGGPLMCKIGQSWVQAAVLTGPSNTNISNSNASSNSSTKINQPKDIISSFTKIDAFKDFLLRKVPSFPPKANITTTPASSASITIKPVGSKSSLFIFFFYVLLLSIPTLIQMFI